MSPPGSSDLPESRRAALCFLFGLASNEVYMCPVCYQPGGSLLHCLSTLTGRTGGLFLLHCLWSHLRQTLSGILPCEARTFLSHGLSVPWQRPSVLLANATYSIILFLKCLYPIITSTTILSMIQANKMDTAPQSSTGSIFTPATPPRSAWSSHTYRINCRFQAHRHGPSLEAFLLPLRRPAPLP